MTNKAIQLICFAAALALVAHPAAAQNPVSKAPVSTVVNSSGERKAKELIVAAPPAAYKLGPGDQVQIWALGLDEAGQHPVRVDSEGFIVLPLIGRVHAHGLTTDELRQDLAERLKTYVREPQVTVNLTEFGSQPVSVVGAVNKVGSLQLQGPKTLIEVLSEAGGLKEDSGNTITVTRSTAVGTIPLLHTRQDHSGQFTIAEIPVRDLFNGADPNLNIAIMPHDVIAVDRGHVVYVMGEVQKRGGFNIGDRPYLTVSEALANAEGPKPTGAPQNAKILRTAEEGQPKQEIAVNAKLIMQGKQPDVRLQPDDILVIPENGPRNFAIKALETAVNIGTGVTIWRVGYPTPR